MMYNDMMDTIGLVDKAEPVGGQEVEPAPEHAEAEKEQDDDGFLHCAAPSSFAARETDYLRSFPVSAKADFTSCSFC